MRIRHRTRLEYDREIAESIVDARLGPRTDPDQRWDRFDLRVTPAAAVRRYADGFGNAAHLITIAKPHRALEIAVTSQVETLRADPFVPSNAPRPLDAAERSDYLDPSPLVPAHPALREIAERHAGGGIESAQRLMRWVHDEFTYEPDVTDVSTTVAELLETRTGVCQDLTHVLIGLCRAAGIPARYASGYVIRDAAAGTPTRGAEASHAWAECWTPTHGWRGFDPTNCVLASEHHVKMAIGRDYRDVSPTRGSFRGVAGETLTVEVATEPV